jgi:hypothetical protein
MAKNDMGMYMAKKMVVAASELEISKAAFTINA